jgi:hypothetical protein
MDEGEGTWRITASCATPRTVLDDDADQSTLTTTPGYVMRLDISLLFLRAPDAASVMPMTLDGGVVRVRKHWSPTGQPYSPSERETVCPFGVATVARSGGPGAGHVSGTGRNQAQFLAASTAMCFDPITGRGPAIQTEVPPPKVVRRLLANVSRPD